MLERISPEEIESICNANKVANAETPTEFLEEYGVDTAQAQLEADRKVFQAQQDHASHLVDDVIRLEAEKKEIFKEIENNAWIIRQPFRNPNINEVCLVINKEQYKALKKKYGVTYGNQTK